MHRCSQTLSPMPFTSQPVKFILSPILQWQLISLSTDIQLWREQRCSRSLLQFHYTTRFYLFLFFLAQMSAQSLVWGESAHQHPTYWGTIFISSWHVLFVLWMCIKFQMLLMANKWNDLCDISREKHPRALKGRKAGIMRKEQWKAGGIQRHWSFRWTSFG